MENNRLGILGAFIGGLVGCIPWIIAYIYLGMMLSVLAAIVAYCALYGYNLFKGGQNENLPKIITIVSILCVGITTLVIIPALLIYKATGSFAINQLIAIYEDQSIFWLFMKDLLIALIFTGLGIKGTITKLQNQVNEQKNQQ